MILAKKIKVKKNKSKSKKLRTFTSSEFSMPEENRNISMSELFRNDALKRRQPPSVLTTAAVKKNKSQKQLQTTKKRTKSKSKLRLDKCQTYEVIPYKNSLNSEIVFSNEDTRREGSMEESSADQIAIKVNQQYLLDNNRLLRISIKKQYQKKVDAAIKIQKVFRGFLTRKVLQNCLEKEHKKLQQKLAQLKSQSVSEHSSYFCEKEKENLQSRKRVVIQQQGIFEYSNNRDNEEDSQEEEEADRAIYRHHQPIYSHDEISGYLESSEDEDFDQDAFDNHIIFETNEEYIDSRKSSLQQQQPKNKLSRAGHPQPISEEPPQTPQNTHAEEQFSKTEKKQDRERIKNKLEEQSVREQTLKLNEDSNAKNINIHHFLHQGEYESNQGQKETLRKSPQKIAQLHHVSRLKEDEVHKWGEIIDLIQSQLSKNVVNNSDITSFMKQIMDLSLKNKQTLELDPPFIQSPSQESLHSESSMPHNDSKSKLKTIKAQRLYLTNYNQEKQQQNESESKKYQCKNNNNDSDRKKENISLSEQAFYFKKNEHSYNRLADEHSNVPANCLSPNSSFQNTGHLKRFLSGNIQDENIQQMLKLREDLMKRREIQDMRELNLNLENKVINQETFLTKLQEITKKYMQEKICIERSKEDISRGYKAALKLTKEAAFDAKRLGYKLPFSRSVQGLRFKSPITLGDIIIDELPLCKEDRPRQMKSLLAMQREPQERMHIDLESDEESSDLQFTEEELNRFRRAQPYDIELAEQIADLGRNVMISQQLLRQQQAQEEQNSLMMTQHVCRERYEIEESSPLPNQNPNTDLVTDWLIQAVFYEAAGQFMLRPLFSERLIDKNQFHKPEPVSDKERLRFLELLQNNFPPTEHLNVKLNQKICPLPSELLRCMRIDFSEDDEDDNSYEEIGKYEFIIGQDICNEAIKIFKQQIEEATPTLIPNTTDVQLLGKSYNFGEKLVRYLQQREKYVCNRRNHTKELRWEVLNIQIHCIFDAWNEELIYLRSQKIGYSGIGLNELTLSVRDHNSLISLHETLSIIKQGRKRLIKNLSMSSPQLIFPAVVEEDEDELLQQDSKWIFYADEALSYGLELVYLIEEQIFSEIAKEVRKKILQLF